MERFLKGFFRNAAKAVAAKAIEGRTVAKAAAGAESEPWDVIDWIFLTDNVQPILESITKDGAAAGLVQIENYDPAVFEQANDNAVAWAKARGAEMIGMHYDSTGNLIENPDAQWAIDEPTREGIRSLLAESEKAGWSNDTLAKEIKSAYAFSESRSKLIARTETAMADVRGNMIAYRASGQVAGKYWITAADDLVSDDCQMNADAGIIGLEDDFPSGDDAPLAHPRCRCDCIPVMS